MLRTDDIYDDLTDANSARIMVRKTASLARDCCLVFLFLLYFRGGDLGLGTVPFLKGGEGVMQVIFLARFVFRVICL